MVHLLSKYGCLMKLKLQWIKVIFQHHFSMFRETMNLMAVIWRLSSNLKGSWPLCTTRKLWWSRTSQLLWATCSKQVTWPDTYLTFNQTTESGEYKLLFCRSVDFCVLHKLRISAHRWSYSRGAIPIQLSHFPRVSIDTHALRSYLENVIVQRGKL